jgi:phage/plasmid-like protein (TIGR03299 family)
MAHGITETDTMVSYNGVVPWHRLGTVVSGYEDQSDALTRSGINYTVDGGPVYTTVGDDVVEIKGYKAQRRSDTGAVLAITGEGFSTLQNPDWWADMVALVSAFGDAAQIETAGTLNGGRKVWILANLPGFTIEPVRGDRTIVRLLGSNSHDGSSSAVAKLVSERVVCANTLGIALGERGTEFKIRHTGNMDLKRQHAAKFMQKAIEAVGGYGEKCARLADTGMTDEAWNGLLLSLFPVKDDAKITTRGDAIRDRILTLSATGLGQDIPGVAGSAWAALNAVTEWTTHERGTRSVDGRDVSDARLDSVLFGSSDRMANDALAWLTTYATTGKILLPA